MSESPDELVDDPLEGVGTVYVPYTEGVVNVSVWAVDKSLMMFTNITEEMAANLAEGHSGHIYFFAELTAEGV